MVNFETRIQFLKGVGEARAKSLAKQGIYSIGDLLRNYPRAYEDWNNTILLRDAQINESICVRAIVAQNPQVVKINGGRILVKTVISDGSDYIPVTFFNNKYVKDQLIEDQEYLFFGKITLDKYNNKTMLSPRFEKSLEKQRIRPIYKATSSMPSKTTERLVETALREIKGNVQEIIPEYIVKKYRLMSFEEALRAIHFPESEEQLGLAKRRLIFEELLLLQMGLLCEKTEGGNRSSIPIKNDYTGDFYSTLPFDPTNAQKRAIFEAVEDMKTNKQMNRLLQGDVGSGKTAVAAALMYNAVKNGFQAALMAPTEVLANQHFKTLSNFFGDDINICLLTGSVTAAKKRDIRERLKDGDCDIVVGTHAIIQSDVEFNNLGLVITDEQHRFGVGQRASLSNKGNNPHTLVMSATPIPRTLAMMIYGDLDISVLDELPKGRQPIKTYHVPTSYHERIYNFIRKNIATGQQAYIVCPLVSESDSDLVPATEYYDYLKSTYFADCTLGLLHGQMKPKEKDAVMDRFYSGEIQLLISTVVIEVGVDVPNATVMAIENAERFGLSQLHQLRGRIGRGSKESTCILLSDAQNEEAVDRFETMCRTTDGFEIAKKDLEIRGPGDFFGSRQHGLPDMRIANLMTDTRILYEAQKTAKELVDNEISVTTEERHLLAQEMKRLFTRVALN
ncbi:MAG: ATP-dependent DNA helicase RecG [Acutalibacteraceae bacterium]|nr:ATP-dependent DNA helicase RecG [Acutalibacteraceae bacterium]